MKNNLDLTSIQALAIDMDGVLWRGSTPLPGLNQLFDFLKAQQFPFMLATNNASKTPEQYQKKFAGLGVTVQRSNILTSSLATAAYLQEELPAGSRVYVLGQTGLREAIREAGFVLAEDASQPVAAVAGGIDFNLTYETLKYASLLIRGGARFVGSNGDLTFPSEEGFVPGAGSILAAVEAATGVKPTIIGKPEPLMFKIAVKKMQSQPAHTVMIGDRLETDILGGQQAGLKTILVSTGVDSEATIAEKNIQPDAIFSGIDALVDAWQAQLRG